MADTIKGHLIKYKLPDGTWVGIPVAIVDVYDTYLSYCQTNNISPVNKQVYFQTLGNLQTLVDDLSNSTGAIEELNQALSEGVLPVSKGGTGYSDETQYLAHLKEALITLGIATSTEVNNKTNPKLNASDISAGTADPITAGATGKYYFQYVD